MRRETIHVLLIEHNLAEAKRIGEMLGTAENPCFEVKEAESLEGGLAHLKSRDVDVLLLALGPPESSAVEVLSRASSVAPDVPIIALVRHDNPTMIHEIVNRGVRNHFVQSRINSADLIRAILREAARKRRLSGDLVGYSGWTRKHLLDAGAERTFRVLVVEENPNDLAFLKLMLQSIRTIRFEITPASNLSSALENLLNGPDVVFLDLNLPDSQGVKTLRVVRAHEPFVPIIILAGMGNRGQAVEALATGAQDYIIKGQVDGHLLESIILRQVRVGNSEHPPQ
jgi:DNA-binding NarL/FixJ family response regulator